MSRTKITTTCMLTVISDLFIVDSDSVALMKIDSAEQSNAVITDQ